MAIETLLLQCSRRTSKTELGIQLKANLHSFDDLLREIDNRESPVITLFSGGLDSSYLLLRLVRAGVTDIHALAIDIGDVDDSESRKIVAHNLGVKLIEIDAQERFVSEFVRPAILTRATYLDTHPISSSLSRPLISQIAVEYAEQIGSSIIVHTANRSQNSLRRLNGAIRDLNFTGSFGSPYENDPIDRNIKAQELEAAGVTHLASRSLSGDSNLWCREYESGYLDNPEDHDIEKVQFEWSNLLDAAQDEFTIHFEKGIPVAINEEKQSLVALIQSLNYRVGRFGLGVYSGLEHLEGGEKVFEVREMPAAWLIFQSLRHLESSLLTAGTIQIKQNIEQVWTIEAIEGRWFQPLREAAQRFCESTSQYLSGDVRWVLRPGRATTSSIVVKNPLYLRDRELWECQLSQSSIRANVLPI